MPSRRIVAKSSLRCQDINKVRKSRTETVFSKACELHRMLLHNGVRGKIAVVIALEDATDVFLSEQSKSSFPLINLKAMPNVRIITPKEFVTEDEGTQDRKMLDRLMRSESLVQTSRDSPGFGKSSPPVSSPYMLSEPSDVCNRSTTLRDVPCKTIEQDTIMNWTSLHTATSPRHTVDTIAPQEDAAQPGQHDLASSPHSPFTPPRSITPTPQPGNSALRHPTSSTQPVTPPRRAAVADVQSREYPATPASNASKQEARRARFRRQPALPTRI